MLSKKEKIHLLIFLLGCLVAMGGFFFSRFLLSVAAIILIANSWLQNDVRARFQSVLSNPLLSGIAALFLMAFVSGMWSEDKSAWVQACTIKLPLLFFPFVFVFQKGMKKIHWVWLSLAWMALVLCGSFWTMFQYFFSKENYEMLYQVSKVLPTWAADNHIRFSMAVIIALLLWIKLETWNYIESSGIKFMVRCLMIWLVAFLVILSAKTGWVGLFVVVMPLCLFYLLKKGYRKIALAFLLIAVALPFIAYKTVPTFRVRVGYVMHEWRHFGETKAAGVYSDHNRLLSIQAGWDIFCSNWLAGVGYGDLKQAMDGWFNANAPQVPETERFRPLNQWLNAGAASGIFGIFMVSLVVLLPFLKANWRRNKPALAFMIYMGLIFLYECSLEDQLGVFLFTFFILWWGYSNEVDSEIDGV